MSAKNDDGWICLHRELLEKPIWANSTPEQKAVLVALLLMANHKPKQWEWDGKKFVCGRGQFVTSLQHIAEKSGPGVSIQNVRTALKRFENLEFLTNQSTKEGRLITICNYSKYQDNKNAANKATNSQLTNDQQRPNKDLTTNNNDNKIEDTYMGEDLIESSAQRLGVHGHRANGKHNQSILFEQIKDIYNETLGYALPSVVVLSESRKKALKARCSKSIGDRKTDNPEFWRGYFGFIANSCPYLLGRTGKKWTANFDWLIKEDNFIKVVEGAYQQSGGEQ